MINFIVRLIFLSLDKIPYNELFGDDLSFNKMSFDKIWFRQVNVVELSIFLLLVCDAHKMGQLVNDFFSNWLSFCFSFYSHFVVQTFVAGVVVVSGFFAVWVNEPWQKALYSRKSLVKATYFCTFVKVLTASYLIKVFKHYFIF